MSSVAVMWQTDRPRLIGLAGAGIAVAWILVNLSFFFRPGTSEVLGGLAHHGFVLGLMLLLTAGSRTVSFGTLGIFWLLGVWGVYAVTYLLESQLANVIGAEVTDRRVPEWVAPFVEELTKVTPVAIFLLAAGRSGYCHPSMSDGMLLGFVLGAGVSFQEDAQFGKILVSGDGWDAATPWSTLFPTISPVGTAFALNHALWAALSGLGVGAALMLSRWRFAWLIAVAGLVLALTNHMLVNHFVGTVGNALQAVGRAKVTQPFGTIQDLTGNGRLPMEILIAGAVAVVIGELMIQRWVAKRDRMFPPLARQRVVQVLQQSTSRTGIATLLAADRYMCLRRSLYFAGWQTSRAGGYPGVTDADYAELISLAVKLHIFSAPASPNVSPGAAAFGSPPPT